MLSRIAESLFWIGRYVERADGTARILDAYIARLLEDPWADEDRGGRAILSILGAVPPDNARGCQSVRPENPRPTGALDLPSAPGDDVAKPAGVCAADGCPDVSKAAMARILGPGAIVRTSAICSTKSPTAWPFTDQPNLSSASTRSPPVTATSRMFMPPKRTIFSERESAAAHATRAQLE